MDSERARELLTAQRDEVQALLDSVGGSQNDDRSATADSDSGGDIGDTSAPLDAEAVDDAIAAGLQEKLARIERAFARLDNGTYGRSVQSGAPIPDARLEADPAAELTVEEAAPQAE